MIDFLYNIDLSVFYFFNDTISTPILDRFFSTITNVNNWYIAYIILLCIMFFKGGKRGKLASLGIILLILFSDQISHNLIKETFARIRPCNSLPDVLTPLGCTGSYSFPSNHAVNNFAAAMFFSILYPKFRWILFTTAFLVALSRVYLGLHYPSDIAAGALIGAAFGYIYAWLQLKVEVRLVRNKSESSS